MIGTDGTMDGRAQGRFSVLSTARRALTMRRLPIRALSRALSATSSKVQTLYCARTHAWLQPRANNVVRVGLTEHALEDIGEVESVTHLIRVGESAESGAELLRIDWEALRISDGDELYHTRWANITGDHTLAAPVAGTLVAVNDEALQRGHLGGFLESEEWLVELELAAQSDLSKLLSGDQYEAHASTRGAGKFGTSSEALTYTSYG